MDVIEIYIPAISFAILFIAFVLQIFFRYFLNNPLTWPFEVTTICFIWTTCLAASYAQRHKEHVQFSLIYDLLPPKGQLIVRILGNSLVIIVFGLIAYPCYDYIQFMEFDTSTVLEIPFNIIFFPFMVFLFLISARLLGAVILDLKKFTEKGF